MVVQSLILMRHAEREDRALEKEGKDWISTAARPQDPLLSPNGKPFFFSSSLADDGSSNSIDTLDTIGRLQAAEVGRQLKGLGITKILTSPMIRTVLTADIIAEVLGFGENSICVEMGLVEEAKSFRGKTSAEPRPNWEPLILPVSELLKYSSRIDASYVPLTEVKHVRDESVPNTVRELYAEFTDRDEVTKERCKDTCWKIIQSDKLDGEVVLCVGHGATVKNYAKALESGLPDELLCTGERTVSCFGEFKPLDAGNPTGPWKSVTGVWGNGDIFGKAAEDLADRG